MYYEAPTKTFVYITVIGLIDYIVFAQLQERHNFCIELIRKPSSSAYYLLAWASAENI